MKTTILFLSIALTMSGQLSVNTPGAGGIELSAGAPQLAQPANTFWLMAPPLFTAPVMWIVPPAPCVGYLYTSDMIHLQCSAGTGSGGGGSSVGPSVSATNSVNETFPGNSSQNQKISFDTNQWDTGSFHSTTVNPTRFTAPSAGFYLAVVTVACNSTTSAFNVSLLVNGTTAVGAASQAVPGGSMWPSTSYTFIVQLNAGDYIEVNTYTVGGYTITAHQAFFQLTKLSSTF